MQFILQHTETMTATEPVRCDAIAAFFDRAEVSRKNGNIFTLYKNDIIPINANKSGVIETGKKYIQFTFCDEHGEGFLLNISTQMISVTKQNKLFPDHITKQIK